MSPQIQDLDRLLRDVPAMPVVAQKVMHMLGDPRTTNSQLGQTLSSDQSMASRILQMANSPFFGTRQKISSINNAIFVLGHSALRSLVITVCTKGLYKNPALMEEKNWEHALGTAVAARHLALKVGRMDPDDAFIGGLLHDIGRTILISVYRDAYQDIFARDYNEGLRMEEVLALEKEEFGYDHAEIGARVISKWRLPAVYSRIARRHHAPSADVIDSEDDPAAIALVGQANYISLRLGLGRREPMKGLDLFSTVFQEMLETPKDRMLEIVESTIKDFSEAKDQFKL